MKRILLFSVLSLFILTACSSDDEGNVNVVVTVSPDISINLDAIVALPPGSDITALVNFGQPLGESAADFVSEVSVGNRFTLGQPSGLQTGDQFLYNFFLFLDEDEIEVEVVGNVVGGKLEAVLPDGVTGVTVDEYYNPTETNGVPEVAWEIIDAEADNDVEWKYSIDVFIESGDDVFGPYIIDPKIRIKRLNQ